ncbi:MAG: methyltransferase [delta proteobacterium MLS_D]|jgi:FkbM family methyltransferase|nr:MAG: methyltransferase [delta proteobacterium MLS_D]
MEARFLWRAFRARYRDEKAELSAIRDYVRPGDTVCDIGANKGAFVWWMSRWVGDRGRVAAFEPQEELADYLRRVCRKLSLSNITVEAKAVDAVSGTRTLYVPGSSGNSPGASLNARLSERENCRATTVPVVALDDYFDPGCRVTVLKIDVEGAEPRVFEGARRILKERSPLLVFECENRHLESGDVFDVFRILLDLGYEGDFVCGRRLRPLAEFDPSVHQREIGERFWDRKDYCNNFIFRKRS